MNEQLQAQLAEYLKAIATAAQSGAGFVMEQAPLVVQEKIAYGRALETTTFALLLIVAACWYRIARWGIAKAAADKHFDHPGFILSAVFGCAGTAGFTAMACFGVLPTVLMVWFAPRLYILEWAIRMVK